MSLSAMESDSIQLKAILTAEVVTVGPETPLRNVFLLMQERPISSVVIVDDALFPVGILTEHDAIKLMARKVSLTNLQVQEVMSRDLLTTQADTESEQAYQMMIERQVRHLVVVDDSGKLVGMVSEGDFLHHMGMEYLIELKTVANAMTQPVITLDSSSHLHDALILMSTEDISCVVLVKNNMPVGIITERDMVRLADQMGSAERICIADEMSFPLATVTAEVPIHIANRMMEHYRVRRLVVVGAEGELVGLLTRHDIIKSFQGSYIEYLHETLHSKGEDLHYIETRLRDIEQKVFYKSLVDQVSDSIFVIDAASGRILDANQRAARNLQMTVEELLDKQLSDFCLTINSSEVWLDDYIPPLREQEELLFNSTYLRTDGSEYPVEVKAHLVSFGMKEYVVAVSRDVTEREQNNKRLKESEQRFQSLFENAPLAYQSLDMEGNIKVVNNAWLDLMQCQSEEAVGHPIQDFLTPHSISTLHKEFPKFVKGGRVDGPLFEFASKKGSTTLVRINGQIGLEPVSGEPRTHCILTDVTESERAAASLRESEERFRRLFMESPLAMGYVDNEGNLINLNNQFENIFGYTMEDLPNLDSWFSAAYKTAEQQQEAKVNWENVVHKAVHEGGLIDPYEHVIQDKYRKDKIVRFSGMKTEQGFLIILEDITEQKKASEALKESAEIYFGVISTAQDGFWILDSEGRRLMLTSLMSICLDMIVKSLYP